MSDGKKFGLEYLILATNTTKKHIASVCGLSTQSNITKWIDQKNIPSKHLQKLEEVFGIDKYYLNRDLTLSEQEIVQGILKSKRIDVSPIQIVQEIYSDENEYLGTEYFQVLGPEVYEKELMHNSIRIRQKLDQILPIDCYDECSHEKGINSLEHSTSLADILEMVCDLIVTPGINIDGLRIALEAIKATLLKEEVVIEGFGETAQRCELKRDIKEFLQGKL